MPKTIPGVHIQWPWSQLILSGKKVVETRGYPIPHKHLGKPLALIETAGPLGKARGGIKSASIIGIVVFSECYRYESRAAWLRERKKHRVPATDTQFGFDEHKQKWAWVVERVEILKEPKPAPKRRGIVFASACNVAD